MIDHLARSHRRLRMRDDHHPWRPEDLGTIWSPSTEDRIRAGIADEADRDRGKVTSSSGRRTANELPPEVYYS